jgi:hypothetical protein
VANTKIEIKRIGGIKRGLKTKNMDGWDLLLAKILDDSIDVDKIIRGERRNGLKMSKDQKKKRAEKIKTLSLKGIKHETIAKKFGLSIRRVYSILKQG